VKYRPRVVDLVLDPESTIPLYRQLKQHIVHLISSGGWQPGAAVPPVRQLANDLQMSTATVQRAYNELQAQGLLIGRAGRGVFVGELATGVSQHPAERDEMLRALFAHAVLHARSLGFVTPEVISTVRSLMGDETVTVAASRVIFVGAQPEFVEKYSALLRDALGRFDLEVQGVVLSDLEHQRVELDSFGPIRVLVSLIGTFADVQRLVRHHNIPLYGLVVDLTEATQRALVRRPTGEPVALVAERMHLPSARAILRQYFGSEDDVRWAALGNRPAVRRIMDECSMVVHTLGAKHLVEEYATPETRLIELEYLPNEASLARLVEMVAMNDLGDLVPVPGYAETASTKPSPR
jgi:GntR family transcriptional regulator